MADRYFTTNARFTKDGVKKGGSASELMDYDTALQSHFGYMSQQIAKEENYKVLAEIRDYDNDFKCVKREIWTRSETSETTDSTATA